VIALKANRWQGSHFNSNETGRDTGLTMPEPVNA